MNGFVCSPHLYRYCGLLIEERPIGPRWWPLKANGEPYQRWPGGVAAIIREWDALHDTMRARHHVGGGCKAI
ncbi:MAG: hypothetical protein WC481_07700 [Candidatus Omnitrophota bacterium]